MEYSCVFGMGVKSTKHNTALDYAYPRYEITVQILISNLFSFVLPSHSVVYFPCLLFLQEERPQTDVELQNVLNASLQETTVLFEPEQNTHSLVVHETNRLEGRSPSPRVVVNSLDICEQGTVVFPPPYEEREDDPPPPSYEEVSPGKDDRGRPETPPPLYDDIMYER